MPYVKNKGANQPAHQHSLINPFVVSYLDSITSNSEILANFVAEPDSLRQTWLQTVSDSFSLMWLNENINTISGTDKEGIW